MGKPSFNAIPVFSSRTLGARARRHHHRRHRHAANRAAHAAGMRHAEITRSRVLAALEALRADGLTQAELLQYVEGITKTETAKEPK